ncbi:MAG: hypothetical protein JWO05_191 [Gemmatimonadetes bacterium]|nr:hypothetical protein [Gemmatimonadota bacterium]
MRFLLPLLASAALASTTHAQDVSARIDSALTALQKEGFSGVVRVEKDGAVLLEKGYGLADRSTGRAMTPATVVQIGSNTKDFTAVAVLQLKDRGLLALTDPISKYFPGAPADKKGITIQQLLDHSAGLPEYAGGDYDPATRQQIIDAMMKAPLRFTPGAKSLYSNPGFSLLAAIIEQLTGKTYDAYVRDAILAPLGLRKTGFLFPNFASDELAHGYFATGKDNGTMLSRAHAADGPYWNLRGNGGMLSTVEDMHAFYSALFEGERLLRAETRDLRFDPRQPVGLAGSDGIDFFLYERDPIAHTEIIIAANNPTVRPPRIRGAVAGILGLPNAEMDGPPEGREGGHPAPAPILSAVSELVAALNSADDTKIAAVIRDHFAVEPDAPSVAVRTERFKGLHERFGDFVVTSVEAFDSGPVDVHVSSKGGNATLKVQVDLKAPWKIHSIQLLAGGD